MKIRDVKRSSGLFLLFAVFSFTGCSVKPSKQVYIDGRDAVAHGKIIEKLEGSRVIFIGEAHTSEMDHVVQMEVIRRINESGRKAAVALEMFPNTLQPVLNAWVRGEISETRLSDAYYYTWTVPYSQYSGIFGYARRQGIPLVGINVDPSYISYIKAYGIERVSEETLRLIKYSSCKEETGYAEDMRALWGSMDHKGGFGATCDILRFREAFMAYNLSRSLAGNDYTFVVILGAIHALDFAVPEMLERHSGERSRIILSEQFKELLEDYH